jgi:outer membrane protein TolC
MREGESIMRSAWSVAWAVTVMVGVQSAAAQGPAAPITAAVAALPASPAASAAPVDRLTLDQCVTAALKNNGRRKAAEAVEDQASARHGRAMSSRYPSLSATLSATRFDEDPNFVFPGSTIAVPASTIQTPPMVMTLPANAFGPGFPPANVSLPVPSSTIPIPAQAFQVPEQNVKLMDKNLFTGSLNAMYALYTGGLAGARIRQARAGIDAARQERRQTEADLVFDVKRTYYGVVLARKLRATAADTLERMRATLDLTESLYKSGSGRVKKTDYLRHRAMVETIASMVTEFAAQEETARAALATLIGATDKGDPDVADEDFPAGQAPLAVDGLVREALTVNPQIGRVQAGLVATKAGIAAAQAGHLPKVGLFADLHLLGNSYDAGMVTSRNKVTWAFGVGVDVPIFQGFRVVKEVQEAKAGNRALEQQYAALRDGVSFDVRRTVIAIDKARAQLASTGLAYKSATENRELHIRAYQDELVETKDMIESQLVEAVLAGQFFKVQYDMVEARAKLDAILGATGATSR